MTPEEMRDIFESLPVDCPIWLAQIIQAIDSRLSALESQLQGKGMMKGPGTWRCLKCGIDGLNDAESLAHANPDHPVVCA